VGPEVRGLERLEVLRPGNRHVTTIRAMGQASKRSPGTPAAPRFQLPGELFYGRPPPLPGGQREGLGQGKLDRVTFRQRPRWHFRQRTRVRGLSLTGQGVRGKGSLLVRAFFSW